MIDFNSFRLAWGKSFLVSTENDIEVTSGLRHSRAYAVNARLPKGWYMLEIEVRADAAQVKGQIVIQGRGVPVERLGIAVSSRRVSKRLVRVAEPARIGISLDFRHSGEDVEKFRLVRVTSRFSRSRMLKKLQALHPKYRLSILQNYSKVVHPVTDDGRQLWHDYCKLFDGSTELATYSEWIDRFDAVTGETRAAVQNGVQSLKVRPTVTILMIASGMGTEASLLEATIQSIVKQIYPHWELLILNQLVAGTPMHGLLMTHAAADPRIRLISATEPDDTRTAPPDYVRSISGDWITVVCQNDILAEHALYHVVDTINQYPAVDLIYSDEDHIDSQHKRFNPNFKCEWNMDLFRSQDMFGNLGIYRTSLLNAAGGLPARFGPASRYELTLRCVEHSSIERIRHIPRILYHKHVQPLSSGLDLISDLNEKEAGRQALADHLSRTRVAAEAVSTTHGYRVRYALPDIAPLVSLIIPTRNGLTLLRRCIESILTRTTYRNYEIIVVDNGSDDAETLEYMDSILHLENVRVLRDNRPFNYSALNNGAVKEANGTIIGLVNNDIEVISPDWLTEMVSHVTRPEVGVVGAKLLYSDDTVQHAGVIIGLSSAADHVHRGLPRHSPGYQSRAALIQSFSAVTAACLLVKKTLYLELGGLNESTLTVAFNDIDFCLRVNEAGYSVVWTPYAELYHHESATRGEDDTPEKQERAAREVAYMRSRWSSFIAFDPAYNSNLCLEHSDCRVAWPPRTSLFSASPIARFATPRDSGSSRLAQFDRQQSR
jgi:GT2 family glycosyltransferase